MKNTSNNLNLLLIFFLCFFIHSCDQTGPKEKTSASPPVNKKIVKYARGFDIQDLNGYKKLIIKSPYPDAEQYQEFILIADKKMDFDGGFKINVPVEKIIATSTTHIPMIEILGEAESLMGFPGTSYISSEKTVSRLEKGLVKELGNEQDFNTEVLLSLQPDVLIAFSMGKSNKLYRNIEKNGIPVIFNGDWLEDSPLGRAEWIKFFGALYDKEKEADSIFNTIEKDYLQAIEIAKGAQKSPTVISGVLFKDKWNLPAGESFTAKLFQDANTDYLWKESEGQGSLVLSFESVFNKGRDADYWIGSGYYTNMEELVSANSHYRKFNAFETGNIYSFSKRRGPGGGVEYFEFGPLRPHIVLKDLIKVVHPELLPDHTPYFLQKLD
ncbi:ABC transporter substrate-binding protein [Lutimonas saemankumensis]|uniref:ABC transporter substrate-binding protein n=1 Tax=Lutimonas saemankumensis TaxID=483016 RepID=UPI001CD1D286|nr:ABC transporter substrate-binding protein [Lutimonas saemankumensis]MCA0931509.1 ABC transporter substrate-binding protein [Lutimonas saemankumensis]